MTYFDSATLKQKAIDIVGVENALVDLLVRVEESDLKELSIEKGVMQLVSQEQQIRSLGSLGKLTTEVELGGSAANALRGAALLGSRTSYSSAVGADDYGRAFSQRLEELEITNRLAVLPGNTGTCLVFVTPDGERSLNTYLGVCQQYRRDFLPFEDMQRCKMFFTTGYVWDTSNQIDAIEHGLDYAREFGAKVVIDVADPFVAQRSGDALFRQMDKGVFCLFANAEEAHLLVGTRGAAAAEILRKKVSIAVVKDGANGAFIGSKDGVLHVPTHKVSVVDTTGAGDMYAAGFMHGLARNYSLKLCAEIGTLLASDTITHMGVRLSSGLADRVQAHIDQARS